MTECEDGGQCMPPVRCSPKGDSSAEDGFEMSMVMPKLTRGLSVVGRQLGVCCVGKSKI